MNYVLGSGINSGDTMLRVSVGAGRTFNWDNINVDRAGLRAWATHLASQGNNTPNATLYSSSSSAALTLRDYEPEVIENVGDYEFGKKANGTGAATRTGVTWITISGNRFQNATAAPTSSVTNAHAGYSEYGNTTNHNTLDVNVNIYNEAKAGNTDATRGGSDSNTLNLNAGGTVYKGYAGYTKGVRAPKYLPTGDTSTTADAKNNVVNVQGGTLTTGGKLYGGYIATNTDLSAASNGDAKGNTINITSGHFAGNNEVYGGYTEGAGNATGNIFNLGDRNTGTMTATGTGSVFLYGGGGTRARARRRMRRRRRWRARGRRSGGRSPRARRSSGRGPGRAG